MQPMFAFAESLLLLAELYLWAGAAVATLFLAWGVDRVDASARGQYLFRLLAAPGVIGLWPLVLWRWWDLARRSGEAD